MLTFDPSQAVIALHAEAVAIAARLAAAQQQLSAAQASANAPRLAPPTPPTVGELERARLQDLADDGSRLATLEQQHAAAVSAYEADAAEAAQAGRDAEKAEAAIAYEREALEEARALELSAISAAVSDAALSDAAAAYEAAASALGAAAAAVDALQAMKHAPSGYEHIRKHLASTGASHNLPTEVVQGGARYFAVKDLCISLPMVADAPSHTPGPELRTGAAARQAIDGALAQLLGVQS